VTLVARTAWLLCFAAALLPLSCSAGPKTYEVSGTASLDGQPIAQGDITFLAADGSVSPDHGKIENGRFQARVKGGKKKVEIRATREVGRGPLGPRYDEYVPARYNSQTILTAEVPTTDGTNRLDFPLQSP
jgi:hypothetical protein